MTRIIAGSLKGRRLATPSGDRTRPTADRVREALFNALAPGGDLTGYRFADLYAGSGAVGLEAISRGAEHALFVESHIQTAKLLRRNVAELGVEDAEVISASVEKVLSSPRASPTTSSSPTRRTRSPAKRSPRCWGPWWRTNGSPRTPTW
ncbi:hypothetical protein GCM10029992_30000 [Glycomyces albus]